MYKVKIFDKTKKRVIINSTNLNGANLNNHIINLTKDIIYLVDKKELNRAIYENKALKWYIRKID